MNKITVPFFPPDMFEADKEIIYKLIYQAGTSNNFILKDNVEKLEEEIKAYSGAKAVVAVHSGTGAVSLALRALGIGPGDEVITQGFCCQPVASEVIHLGAKPIFVDVDPHTMVMDPAKIESRITKKTKAILPAHLFSCMVDMPAINKIAKQYNLKVVEDACVVQGAKLNNIPAGLWGDIGTWSFFQMKVMGGCGEGGVVLTNDLELADRCRILRNHGQTSRFHHELIGVNSRMDEIMAGFLLYRLKQFDSILKRRIEIAEYYHQRFAEIEGQIKRPPLGSTDRCYYMYNIQVKNRQQLQDHLLAKGIATHIYYPRVLTEQRAFMSYQTTDDELNECFRVSRENLAIPIYPRLTDEQAKLVADAIVEFYQ